MFHSPVGRSASGCLITRPDEPGALREEGPLAGRVVVPDDRGGVRARLNPDGDGRADGVEVADVLFLNLELDRARPDASLGAGLGVDVVEQAAVARGRRLRREAATSSRPT